MPTKDNVDKVEVIMISSCKYQNEIIDELKRLEFQGEVVTFYNADENEFIYLPSKNNQDYFFMGKYNNWNDAKNMSIGYDEKSIAEKVLNATLQVMNGQAKYERDSVLFYEEFYNYRLISVIGLLATKKKKITVLDVGGALGSEYWRNITILNKFGIEITWIVYEQENYVNLGEKYIKDIQFTKDLPSHADVVLLSSVLQYIPDYQEMLRTILQGGSEYILIDRQPVADYSQICIQYVGSNIYNASYPMQVINKMEMNNIFTESNYKLLAEFDSEVDKGIYYLNGKEFKYKGFLYEKLCNTF